MQSPSFLAHQRLLEQGHRHSNYTGLFGMAKIPSDNHIRAMLDGAQPSLLQPAFDDVLAAPQQAPDGFNVFRRLGDHLLIAFDGTEYFCSDAIHCPQCSSRRRGPIGRLLNRPGRGSAPPVRARVPQSLSSASIAPIAAEVEGDKRLVAAA